MELSTRFLGIDLNDTTDKFTHHEDGISYVDFAIAIRAVKEGYRITRKGWNGRGMFVIYQKGYPEGIPCNLQTAEAWGLNEGDPFVCQPYLQIKNVDGSHSMWVPSINDCLATDWMILDNDNNYVIHP